MNILFVCLGNICRSPLAEGLFAHLVQTEGLNIGTDSAGVANYEVGNAPDPRSRACARRHGIELDHRARVVGPEDFRSFDLLIAMDQSNVAALRRLAPPNTAHKIRLLREWDPAGPGEVPDPYYGGESDFEHVWQVCERSMPRLIGELRQKVTA